MSSVPISTHPGQTEPEWTGCHLTSLAILNEHCTHMSCLDITVEQSGVVVNGSSHCFVDLATAANQLNKLACLILCHLSTLVPDASETAPDCGPKAWQGYRLTM